MRRHRDAKEDQYRTARFFRQRLKDLRLGRRGRFFRVRAYGFEPP
jgi:hypothetical protein